MAVVAITWTVLPHLAQALGLSSQRNPTIDHVTDGDTITLDNGSRVRLVQIDTPEVYFGTECYGPQASAITKRLLPTGTTVRLTTEPATDSVDQYGRLLRYVIRARDASTSTSTSSGSERPPLLLRPPPRPLRVLLERLALRARCLHLGLWGRCRHPLRPLSRRRHKPVTQGLVCSSPVARGAAPDRV